MNRKSVLLRTIGASRKQILVINALEYSIPGRAGFGYGESWLALAGSWALAKFSFNSKFSPQWLPGSDIGLLNLALAYRGDRLMNSRE